MKQILPIIFLLALAGLSAQDEQDTTYLNQWVPSGVVGLNVSQIAFSDWSQGGQDAITYTLFGNFGAKYETISWQFKNDLKLAYGQTKTGNGDFRINDNEFYLESVYSRKVGWFVDPYVSNIVRTSITAGYKYTDTSRLKVADFFDPGYITQAIGFAYNKNKIITTRLGLAFQETFTNELNSYSDDPETPNEVESFRFETGLESVTDVNWEIEEDLAYLSKLRLFTRFESMDVWDVRWDNTITAKINSFLNVNLNFIVVYEKNQSLKTQIKEALQIGIVFNLF